MSIIMKIFNLNPTCCLLTFPEAFMYSFGREVVSFIGSGNDGFDCSVLTWRTN